MTKKTDALRITDNLPSSIIEKQPNIKTISKSLLFCNLNFSVRLFIKSKKIN
jgi:hypothetical protein